MTIDPNLSYYKVSIKYKEIDSDSGKIVNRKANFIVKCSDYADAELLAYYYFQEEIVNAVMTGEQGKKDNEYQLVSIQQIQINDVLINDDTGQWYRFKVRYTPEDGKKSSEYYYVLDDDLSSAAVTLKKHLQSQNSMGILEIMTGLMTNVSDIYQENPEEILKDLTKDFKPTTFYKENIS